MNKKRSLNVTILKYFSILVIITVGAAAASFYYGTTKIVLEYSESVTKHLSDNVVNRTISYLSGPARQSRVVSQLVHSPNIIEDHERLWGYMWEQMSVLPQVQSIFVADSLDNYVQVRREPQLATRYIDHTQEKPVEKWMFRGSDYSLIESEIKTPNFRPSSRPWYINTQTEQKVYWTDVYLFTTAQTPGISATYPILNEQGEKMAVVGVNIPLHSLSEFLAELDVDNNSQVFITNSKHEIIAFPEPNLLTTLVPNSNLRRMALIYELPQLWLRDAYDHYRLTKETQFLTETDNKRYITRVVPFPKTFPSEWQVFVVVPEKDVLGSLNSVLLNTLGIFFAIFLLSLFVVQLFSRYITKPIKQLAIETQKIKDFDLNDVKEVDTNIKEIDFMSKSLMSATTGLQSFRKYVPAALVKQLIELGEEANQGGQEAELTLFFSDIENFTTIAESMHPQDLMAHLSEYFDALSNIVMEQNGTIDKYIGDAIMAFWGAPVTQEKTAYDACKVALLCQKKNEALNEYWVSQHKPALVTRIGLHTGRTIVGNVGSKERINYSVLGDSVNLAARLEGINKLYGTSIIISENTYYQVCEDFFCRRLDIVAVKGKTKGVEIYELICEMDKIDTDLPRPRSYYDDYEKAFNAYLNKQWNDALSILRNLLANHPDDVSVQLMISRCEYFVENPSEVPGEWDGSTTLTTK